MFVRPDVRVSGGLRPLRGHTAPQRPQPGRHARCETEMFGPWTRYCKRRGKGGLKRRIMGRFFFAGCTRVGGKSEGRRRQAEDGRSQMGADGRAPLPCNPSCRPSKNSDQTARGLCGRARCVFPLAADRRLGARAGALTRRRGLFPVCEGCGRPIRRPARRVLSGKRGPY